MREFRSSLPCELYLSGFRVLPVTLEIGDYVISRNICIERKSINDLIMSLNNGRLNNQSEMMCRNYGISCLLIECNDNEKKYFNSLYQVRSKLLYLLKQHPGLRVIWSFSPLHSMKVYIFYV